MREGSSICGWSLVTLCMLMEFANNVEATASNSYKSLVSNVDYHKMLSPDNCHKLCGYYKKVYDIRYEFCFNGVVYNKEEYKICNISNGKQLVYHRFKKLCLKGYLYDRKYHGTCFGKLIDYRKQFCWAQDVHDKATYVICGAKVCKKPLPKPGGNTSGSRRRRRTRRQPYRTRRISRRRRTRYSRRRRSRRRVRNTRRRRRRNSRSRKRNSRRRRRRSYDK